MRDARFWRIDKNADYGLLNELACNRVNLDTAYRNWDDALRLAGSLKLGFLQPGNLMRTLQKGDRMTELQKALIALGRIDKTIYMLNYMDDSTF
jgi:TnpA family transposase